MPIHPVEKTFWRLEERLYKRRRKALSPTLMKSERLGRDQLNIHDFREVVWRQLRGLLMLQTGRHFEWADHMWNIAMPHTKRYSPRWERGEHRLVKPGTILCSDSDGTVMQLTYTPMRGDILGKLEVAIRIPLMVSKGMMLGDYNNWRGCERFDDEWRRMNGSVVKYRIDEWADLVDINYALAGGYDSHKPMPVGTYALVTTIDGIKSNMGLRHAEWVATAFTNMVGASLAFVSWGEILSRSQCFNHWVLYYTCVDEDFGILAKPYLCDDIGPYRYDSANYPVRTYAISPFIYEENHISDLTWHCPVACIPTELDSTS